MRLPLAMMAAMAAQDPVQSDYTVEKRQGRVSSGGQASTRTSSLATQLQENAPDELSGTSSESDDVMSDEDTSEDESHSVPDSPAGDGSPAFKRTPPVPHEAAVADATEPPLPSASPAIQISTAVLNVPAACGVCLVLTCWIDKTTTLLSCRGCGVQVSLPALSLRQTEAAHHKRQVHPACYGLSSAAATLELAVNLPAVGSTSGRQSPEADRIVDPEGRGNLWFCDACARGVVAPDCCLCPSVGGPIKEVRWGCVLYCDHTV